MAKRKKDGFAARHDRIPRRGRWGKTLSVRGRGVLSSTAKRIGGRGEYSGSGPGIRQSQKEKGGKEGVFWFKLTYPAAFSKNSTYVIPVKG